MTDSETPIPPAAQALIDAGVVTPTQVATWYARSNEDLARRAMQLTEDDMKPAYVRDQRGDPRVVYAEDCSRTCPDDCPACDDSVCPICDGGPGNEGACSCPREWRRTADDAVQREVESIMDGVRAGWAAQEARQAGAEAPFMPPMGSRWLHTKSGHECVVTGYCRLERTWELAVLYICQGDPTPVARSLKEFRDGRFVAVGGIIG